MGVTGEDIHVATAKTVDWFSRPRPIELKKLDNNQLWVLRMMLTRPDRRARPVVREKSGGKHSHPCAVSLFPLLVLTDFACVLSADAPLWRMFEPDFEGKVELIACGEREGFNLEIVGNFCVPTRDMLNAPMPEGEGIF